MGLTQTVAPTKEPVSSTEAVEHLRVTSEDLQGDLLDLYVKAAREHVETETHRQLCTATYEYTLDAFPAGGEPILLPRPPLSSVTKVEYVDTDGATQTWSHAEYDVDTHGFVGRITEAYGYSWPTTRLQANAVTVTYVAGYGAASAVPAALKAAVLITVADLNEHREIGLEVAIRQNETVMRLIRNYKVLEVS